MLFTEYDEQEHMASVKEEGQNRVNQLIRLLIRESRSGEIEKAVMDPVYQDQLFQEFNL